MLKVSPSQIKTRDQCEVKYAWEYVEKLRSPPSKVQKFGKGTHKELENWLRTSTPPSDTPEGRTALQGIQGSYLPIPSSGLLIEHEMTIALSLDLVIYGIIDCVNPLDKKPLVIDHKTTSSLRWVMTPEQLSTDPQALCYSIWAMLQFQAVEVDVRWVYYAATNPRSGGPRQPSGIDATEYTFNCRDNGFLDQVNLLEKKIMTIKDIRDNQTKPSCLKPNLDACSQYGGCFHRDRCAKLFNLSKGKLTCADFISV